MVGPAHVAEASLSELQTADLPLNAPTEMLPLCCLRTLQEMICPFLLPLSWEAYPKPGQPVPPTPFLGHHLRLPSSQCLKSLSVPPLLCHPSVSQRVSRQASGGVRCPPGGQAVSWLRAPPWYLWVVPTGRWSLQGLGELIGCRRRCREPAGLAAQVEGGEADDRL